jgi:serine/threonine protein kinase
MMITPLPTGLEMGDEFRIERKLGQGGFGITYLVRALKDIDDRIQTGSLYVVKEFAMTNYVVRDEATNRLVATGNSNEAREQNWAVFARMRDTFGQEARTMAKFSHANIVEVLLIREANETAYIIMEYINGEPLQNRIEHFVSTRNYGLTWPQLAPIAGQMLDALEYVHDRNVIHRDIKPDNIMLRANGGAVLIDFGGARATERARGSMVLTPGFAPAEQYRAAIEPGKEGALSHSVGPAADIYSMAAAFYHAMTGQTPYAVDENHRPIGKRPPLNGHPAQTTLQLPEDAARAIDWALNFEDATMRPQSIREWRRAFPSDDQSVFPAQPGANLAEGRPILDTRVNSGRVDSGQGRSAPIGAHSYSPDGTAHALEEVRRGGGVSNAIGLAFAGAAALVALGLLIVFFFTDTFTANRVAPFSARIAVGADWISLKDALETGGTSLERNTKSGSALVEALEQLTLEERTTTLTIASTAPFRVRYIDRGQTRVVTVSSETTFPKLSSSQLADLELRAVGDQAELVLGNVEYAAKTVSGQ